MATSIRSALKDTKIAVTKKGKISRGKGAERILKQIEAERNAQDALAKLITMERAVFEYDIFELAESLRYWKGRKESDSRIKDWMGISNAIDMIRDTMKALRAKEAEYAAFKSAWIVQ